MRAAVILAGGRSTRFGDADKAVADLAGVPTIRRVADRLVDVPGLGELVVNCRADQVDPIRAALAGLGPDLEAGPAFAVDDEPDRGPVAGIATGLAAVDADYAAVVACDMPFVDPAFLDALFERAAGRDGAVADLDGWRQTTQAVYRAAPTREACAAALARGDGRVVDALAALDLAALDRADVEAITTVETFENLNTRAEFDAAARRLRERDDDRESRARDDPDSDSGFGFGADHGTGTGSGPDGDDPAEGGGDG